MKITSLGHTECLIECPLKNGEVFRVLLDSWLSDYCVADCMERSPRITIDWEIFPKLDMVYISHSHLDHLDPYFLTELYTHQSPLLLLAETLAYLVPTLREQLPVGTRIELLRQLETQTFAGEVELTGLIYTSDELTNEEDVMTLFVVHRDTGAYFEIDTVPPLIAEEQQKLLHLFTTRPYLHRWYLASMNELEGNLSILDLSTSWGRHEFAREYTDSRTEEIEERTMICIENELPLARIWKLSGCKIALIGQWLQFPVEISPELAGTKIMSLTEVATIQNQILKQAKYSTRATALIAGKSIGIGNGEIPGIHFGTSPSVSLDHAVAFSRNTGPQNSDIRDIPTLELSILRALNTRFLPTKLADPLDNLKSLLLDIPSRQYTIAVDYTRDSWLETRYYGWGFGQTQFERLDSIPPHIQERYFANDLDDFLLGRQELYTSFLHSLDPKMSYRLWTVLGNTFLNHDLVIKKVMYHFERAKSGGWSDSILWYYSI